MLMTHWLSRKNGSSDENRLKPSDEGFFLAALQRYGCALHELCVTICMNGDGSCEVGYDFILYLLRYPRSEFVRQLTFDSKVTRAEICSLGGFRCVADESIHVLLDKLAAGAPTAELQSVDPGFLFGRSIEADKYARFRFITSVSVPDESGAFVIAAKCKGIWEPGAFRVRNEDPDYFKMLFDYPCRRYKLRITPHSTVHLTNIEPHATFKGDKHEGERLRLQKSLRVEKGNLCCVLDYPLPGAEYKYTWLVNA
jgi:hypothetical protein